MDANKVYHASDFSVNLCGRCIPKNALYGKTRSYYWYFTDYANIKNGIVTVFVCEKGTQKFKACPTKTGKFLVKSVIVPAMKNFNLTENTHCENVLQLRQINKPSMAMPKPNLGRGRARKIAKIYI